MSDVSKHCQLQIRVSERQKAAIRAAAKRAGLDMSAYILSRALNSPAHEFQRAIVALTGPDRPSYALAEMNSLLTRLTPAELQDAITFPPDRPLPAFLANYVAAMVETACERRRIPVPAWTRRIPPLEEPAFGSDLVALRLHLLAHAPAAFRSRNIFIDSTLGAAV
jgi:hypothetical protein